MNGFGGFAVKHKKLILLFAVILLVPSVIGMALTRINYDMLDYLPDDIEKQVESTSRTKILEDWNF